SGRLAPTLAGLGQAEKHLRASLRSASWPAAIAPAFNTVAMGISVTAAILIGGEQAASGELSATLLAVVVLTPLAVFEVVEGLPAAAVHTLHSAAAARRLSELLADTSSPEATPPLTKDSDSDAQVSLEATNLAIGY